MDSAEIPIENPYTDFIVDCVPIVVTASNQMKWYANEPKHFPRDFSHDGRSGCVFSTGDVSLSVSVRLQCNIRVYHRHRCLDCVAHRHKSVI